MIEKERMVAITDAVIAVAATVMVLKLDIPEFASFDAIRDQFPTLIAYLISFTQIFMAWHEHHDIFSVTSGINHRIFLVNCLWMITVTLIPFVTGVVGNSPDHTLSLILYISVLTLEQLILMYIGHMITKLTGREIQDAVAIRFLRITTLSGYALAALAAFIYPKASLLVIVIVCLADIGVMAVYDKRLGIDID